MVKIKMCHTWMFFFQAGEENPVISLYVVNLNGPLHTIEMRRPEDQRIGWADAFIYFSNVHYGEFYNGCCWEFFFFFFFNALRSVTKRLHSLETLAFPEKLLWWKWYEVGGKTIFQWNTFATEHKRFSIFFSGESNTFVSSTVLQANAKALK